MKEYKVTLGGQERRLAYNSFDAIALFKRFGRPITDLLWKGVLGFGKNGKVGAGFDPEAQIAVLTAGLIRGGSRVTEELVTQWYDTHLQAHKPSGDLLWPAVKAFFYSGAATGVCMDLDEVAEEVGKEAPPAGATAAPPTGPASVKAADGI